MADNGGRHELYADIERYFRALDKNKESINIIFKIIYFK
jgi:hypothetical protein